MLPVSVAAFGNLKGFDETLRSDRWYNCPWKGKCKNVHVICVTDGALLPVSQVEGQASTAFSF